VLGNIGFYFAIKKSKGNMRKMTMKNKDIVNKTLFQSIKEVIVEVTCAHLKINSKLC